jgi:hypothetical protein
LADRYVHRSFSPREGSPLDGILSYLAGESGCNLHENNIVRVTASSAHWSATDRLLKDVVDFKSSSRGFAANNGANSWICFDFKNHRIKPTHYSVRSRTDNDWNHLRSWVFEGSNDGASGWELDRHANDTRLNGQGSTATFAIDKSNEVGLIRIRQTGVNSSGDNHLIVKSIELFGTVIAGVQ